MLTPRCSGNLVAETKDATGVRSSKFWKWTTSTGANKKSSKLISQQAMPIVAKMYEMLGRKCHPLTEALERWWWWVMFYGHFWAHGRLNGPSDLMKRSRRWNTFQLCPNCNSNSDGSDMWSNALPVRPQRRHQWKECAPSNRPRVRDAMRLADVCRHLKGGIRALNEACSLWIN